MPSFRSAVILMLVSAWGCTGSQPVRMQLPPAARVGILNVLETQMTHVDVGSLRIDSFTNVYSVDWDIPGHINRRIEKELPARGRYTFVPLTANASADWNQSMSRDILSAVNAWMPGGLKVFLERTAEENRLDAIISVSSYDSGLWEQNVCFKIGKSPVATKGYGLYTRTRLLTEFSNLLPVGQNTAAPYANIIVAVFQPRPAALAAYGQAPCSKTSLSNFPWEGDLQSLGPAVIRQVRPHVEQLSAEAVQAALSNAGLLP
jgi:hypothetical protein